MALQTSSLAAMPQATHPEPIPMSPRLAPASAPALAPGDDAHSRRLRPLDVGECSLCGIARPLGLLVPDGSPESIDTRWYCKDVKSCTERWTSARPR
jgi:hypothetical protein